MIDDVQWQAVNSRDADQDGRFWYGVISTGIYCRPSCPSRRPLRANVRIFDSCEAAEAAGLRPCRRCAPRAAQQTDPAHGEPPPADPRMLALCRYIDTHADAALDLAQLAAQVHLSPFHLQRRFKAAIGVTPRQYLESRRLAALRAQLREGADVTRAAQDAGLGSAGNFYARVGTALGMTPRQYRAGAAGVAISWAAGDTPLGLLMIGATDRGLCFVQFGDGEAALLAQLRREYPAATLAPMPAQNRDAFERWMAALRAHLTRGGAAPALPLDLRGTAFQLRVWRYLQQIPAGEVRSYREVAEALGSPRAVRAVAGACAANRVALLVPCHRVIRGDGGLGGFKWGLARKRALLDRERAARGAP